jgi:hypothetical protein
MDKTIIADHLAQAEHHVELGKQHIRRQRKLVAELKDDGHDTNSAERLLVQFEELQALHVTHRDRLARELAGLD